MPAIEELLRHELTRAAGQIQAEDLRPLRAPERRPRLARRPLPVVAGLTAITLVAVAALLAGTLAGQRPAVITGGIGAPMPRFYVATVLVKGVTDYRAVVHDASDGHVTGSVPIPMIPVPYSLGSPLVSAAVSGRTFVITYPTAAGPVSTSTWHYFLLRVSATGQPGRLVPMRVPVPAASITRTALSPDGTMLAVSAQIPERPDRSRRPAIAVEDLATGATRVWETVNPNQALPGPIAWTSDRTLAFTWWTGTSIEGIRVLDIGTKPADLLADSRFIPFPRQLRGSVQSAQIAGQGGVIIAASCREAPDPESGGRISGTLTARFVELSASSGALLRVLFTRTTRYTDGGAQIQDGLSCQSESVDPSGQHALVWAFGFGRIDNGAFTALPATVGSAAW